MRRCITSIDWDWASDDEVYAYTYNNANERTEIEWADGSHWDFAYDPMGQVTSGKRKWSDGDFVRGQQFEYTFDDIGNRTQVKMGGNSTGGALRTMNYSRNLLNQITQRAFGAGVDVMGYAPSTSSVTLNGDAAYRHSEFFQKLMVWDNSTESRFEEVDIQIDPGDDELRKIFLPQTPEEFTYDADGNLTQDGRWNYTWDAENRLVQMETRTGLATTLPRRKIEFVYDYIGRRNIKRVYKPQAFGGGEPEGGGQIQDFGSGGMTEEQMESPGEGGGTPSTVWELESVIKFVWDGWNLVAELDGDDEVVRTYAWGLDQSGSEQGAGGVGGLVFQQDGDGGTIYRVSMDGNGNVMTLRDGSGGRVAAYEYGPFGETLTVRGSYSGANPMRFSTKYNDPESALYYYGYRYYNTGTGRWLNRDPAGEAGGIATYAFNRNDSSNYIDSLGLRPLLATFSGINSWTDYIADNLHAFGLGSSDYSWHSSVKSFNYSKIQWARSSKSILDKEARQASSDLFARGAACKSCGDKDGPTSFHVIMVAPKTRKRPNSGSCCRFTIDVFWSPFDGVPNQGVPGGMENERFWGGFGRVHVLDTRYFSHHSDPDWLKRLWTNDLYLNHRFYPFLTDLPVIERNRHQRWNPPAGPGGMPTTSDPEWIRAGKWGSASHAIRKALASDVEHVWVCHSQGCNMAMHSLERICNK